MINSALQGPHNGQAAIDHSKLSPGESDEYRPETPFSFVDVKEEQNAFEMVPLNGRNSIDNYEQDIARPQINITHSDSAMPSHIPQDTIDVPPRPASTSPSPQFLAVDPMQRTELTRFKSLRQGVQRMGSNVSRSTSLRRLNSLKTVHRAWYVEGSEGNNENLIPAYWGWGEFELSSRSGRLRCWEQCSFLRPFHDLAVLAYF
jgi:hypothetical protein